MAYTSVGLPFGGITAESSQASHAGAVDAEPRAATQTAKYLAMLARMGDYGITDWESAKLLRVERTTINSRRVPLVKAGRVYADGFRPGPTGVPNTVWKLR